jgi:hypothetical protein
MERKVYVIFVKSHDSMSLMEYDSEIKKVSRDGELISIKPLKEDYESLSVGDLVTVNLKKTGENVKDQFPE